MGWYGSKEPIALAGRSRSPLAEAIAARWPQAGVERSVAAQDVKWLVPAAAVT